MRVGLVSADWAIHGPRDARGRPWPGGAGWYRMRLPGQYLAGVGVEVGEYAGLAVRKGDQRLYGVTFEESVEELDLIVLQRWTNERAGELIRGAREAGQVVIADVDDWLDGLDPANRAFVANHPRPDALRQGKNRARLRREGASLEGKQNNLQGHRGMVAACDAVTVSTPYLAERLSAANKNVLVLRNALDIERWQQRTPGTTDKPLLGWVGAVAWRSGDVETLRGVLGPFLERHDLQVVHAGAQEHGEFARLAGVDPERVIERPMFSIHEYPVAWTGIEVAVVPLRDAPFNRAKSAIKSMEAAAQGIPWVASWSPENEWWAPERWMVAKRPHQVLGALERLLDPAERARVGALGRAKAEEQSMGKQGWRWVAAYQHVLDQRGAGPLVDFGHAADSLHGELRLPSAAR